MNEAILATEMDGGNWRRIGYTISESATWGFDRFRLYYPNYGTRIGLFSIGDVAAHQLTDANGQQYMNRQPTYGSKLFSSTNAYEHDFSFDLSFNTAKNAIYIYIQSKPTTAEFQQVYSFPTGYGATYNKNAEIGAWDFSVVNTGVNVGASDTSMFFENQPLANVMWLDTSRTPAIYAKTLRFQNSQLRAVDIDNILIWTDTGGVSNGTLDYSGNPNVPTNASKTAYDNLISKGWTITGTAPPIV